MHRIFRTLLIFVLLAAADMKALTEGQLLDAYSYAYSPASKLSKSDFKLIVKLELLSGDWNDALALLVRGLRDPNVVPEEWARSANQSLEEVEQIKFKMMIYVAQIKNSSARSILKQIMDINSQIFTSWRDIRQAMANRDTDAYQRAGMKAQALAQEKITIYGPVMRRLSEKVGDKAFDEALERELRELFKKVSTS